MFGQNRVKHVTTRVNLDVDRKKKKKKKKELDWLCSENTNPVDVRFLNTLEITPLDDLCPQFFKRSIFKVFGLIPEMTP